VNIAVAFTVSCQRQKYLRTALDSWAAVRGVQDVPMLFFCEPAARVFPLSEFTAFVKRSFRRAEVVPSEWRRGCMANTARALDGAFKDADFVVLAEEDLLAGQDVLEYMGWAAAEFEEDSQVKAVCAHALHSKGDSLAQAARVSWFSPLLWGTWGDRWHEYISPGWGPVSENGEGWDQNLRFQIRGNGAVSVFPVRSRSKHIGEISVITAYELAQFFYPNSVSSCFEPAVPPQDYTMVERTPELGLVV
jgi:hypothetical protein